MQEFTIGAGLASFSFWFFLAAVIVGGIWYDIRKKEAQQKTIRSIVESGKDLDEQMINNILSKSDTDPVEAAHDLKVGGIITFFVAVGLAVFGFVLGFIEPDARVALSGIAAMIFFIAVGLFVASKLKYPSTNTVNKNID